MDNRELYHADFYEWTQRTAELIRQERSGEVDRERLAEEIADMGRETGERCARG